MIFGIKFWSKSENIYMVENNSLIYLRLRNTNLFNTNNFEDSVSKLYLKLKIPIKLSSLKP